MYQKAIEDCKKQGGRFVVEGGVLSGKGFESGCYVNPCIAEAKPEYQIVTQETFAPILYCSNTRTLMKLFKFKMPYRKVFLQLL